MAKAFVEEIEDPFLCALAAAPIDDEPETPEEAEAVREGEEDIRAGPGFARGSAPSSPGGCATWGCNGPKARFMRWSDWTGERGVSFRCRGLPGH